MKKKKKIKKRQTLNERGCQIWNMLPPAGSRWAGEMQVRKGIAREQTVPSFKFCPEKENTWTWAGLQGGSCLLTQIHFLGQRSATTRWGQFGKQLWSLTVSVSKLHQITSSEVLLQSKVHKGRKCSFSYLSFLDQVKFILHPWWGIPSCLGSKRKSPMSLQQLI